MKSVVRGWLWLLLLASAGCVQPPPAAVKPFVFESGRTPYSAAICVARNAKTMPNIAAEERLLGDSAWEVVVRDASRGADTLAVAEAHNRGSGSMVSVRVISVRSGDPSGFAQRLMADCQARMIAP